MDTQDETAGWQHRLPATSLRVLDIPKPWHCMLRCTAWAVWRPKLGELAAMPVTQCHPAPILLLPPLYTHMQQRLHINPPIVRMRVA